MARKQAVNIIEGIEELTEKLQTLQKKIKGKEVVDAMRPSARILRDSVKQKLAGVLGRKSGAAYHIAEFYARQNGHSMSDMINAPFYDARDPFHDRVGPSMLIGISGKYPHFHFLEYGVASKNAPAQPFYRPGIDSAKGPAMAALAENLKALIEKHS